MSLRRCVLVLAPALAASALAVVPAAADEAASDTYTRACRHEIVGTVLHIRLTVQFAGPNSDDIKKISVRATDNDESGMFKNPAVELTSALVKVNGPDDQTTTLNKSYKASPFSTNVGPRSNGKDAARVTTIVTWNLPKKRKASMTCFYVNS